MVAIRNYTNTLLELRSCEERYHLLSQRREVYYVKYLGVKSPNYEGVGGKKNWAVDGMSIFLELVTTKNPETGMSLDDELEKLSNEIAELTKILKDMGKSLKSMQGIEYQLYCLIVIDGMATSEAVKYTAEKNYMSERNVWDRYYPKIKDSLHVLKEKK